MPATFTIPLVTVIPGQVLTASLWNNEYNNLYTNFTPAGMDDYSANDSQMQTATDPYPASATSRPTSLQGELERLRYQIAAITGETYWYVDPDTTIATIKTFMDTFPSGTAMVFYQASAPTGWTAVAVNDKFLRVVTAGGTGGTTGGTVAASTSLAHTHTVDSHTHSVPNHQHNLATTNVSNAAATLAAAYIAAQGVSGSGHDLGAYSTGASNRDVMQDRTATDGNTTTGATSPSTDSQLGAFAYADVIIATKN